jgi:hypothetical protein
MESHWRYCRLHESSRSHPTPPYCLLLLLVQSSASLVQFSPIHRSKYQKVNTKRHISHCFTSRCLRETQELVQQLLGLGVSLLESALVSLLACCMLPTHPPIATACLTPPVLPECHAL